MNPQEKPVFVQGTYNFKGKGLEAPTPVVGLAYTVPRGTKSKLVYFRAGQSSDEMISLILLRDKQVMRLFPIGMKSAMHFPLAVTEDLPADSHLELQIAAPEGTVGTIYVDLGFIESGPV